MQGVPLTLEYTLYSSVGGLALGLILALTKLGRWSGLRLAATFYTSVFRGTPMLVQLSIIYFGSPALISYKISPFLAGCLAFSLNSGAYVSEIIRSAIEGIERGQTEAAKALGIPYASMMRDIILPQALRRCVPALLNEVINLLKETALLSILGVEDIMRKAQIISAETYAYFEPLLMAALCYYFLVMGLGWIVRVLERKLGHGYG